MNRFLLPLALLVGCCVGAASGAPAHAANRLCVGGSGCYATLQAAVDAAHDGDTIAIAPGTYAGGVTIDVSVDLVGAGAGKTVIRGGGPVLTAGTYGAPSEPTVSINRLTITGGITRSSPESTPFVGQEGVIALGGGIEIPPNADFSGGANVTITNSVITDNRVAASGTLPFGPPCPGGPCPFAEAAGGGIDSWGTVTISRSTISNNRVGTASRLSNVASDAYAGAIQNWIGPLTISNSLISDNRASASAPNGRFADSGAIFLEGGTLTMNSSTVTDNSATLNAAMPNSVDTLAVAGGIHISDQSSGAISNTTVAGNTVTMTNTVGDANAFSGGVHIDNNDLTLRSDAITDNSVTVAALSSSGGNAAGDSGAGELGGSIAHTLLTGNSVSASSIAGDATADAGATIFAGSISNSIITNNHLHASSPNGAASDHGGGLISGDAITLRNTKVSGNTTDATGQSGVARGGGIYDVDNSADNGPPGGPLTLINSSVTGNVLSGNAAIDLLGGGIFATNPVFLTNSVLAANVPDQCFGC